MMAGSLSPDAIDGTRERDVEEEEAEEKAAVDEHLYLRRVWPPPQVTSRRHREG